MTVDEIIIEALSELGRGTDTINVNSARNRFTHYINESILDIASAFHLNKQEKINVTDVMMLDVNSFQNQCMNLISVAQNNRTIRFNKYSDSGLFKVFTQGEVVVNYRCIPKAVSLPTDIPDIPKALHALIVMYVVAREKMNSDVTTQKGAQCHMELYELMKRRIICAQDGCESITNKW